MSNDKDQIELSENEKEGLRAAAKIITLEMQLAESHETLEMLEVKFSVEGSIEETQYRQEKERHLKNIEKTEKKLQEFRTMEKKAPLLILLEEGRQFRTRREKLRGLLQEKKISEPIFSKMDTEYEMKIDEVEEKLAGELIRLEKIKNQMENVPYDQWLEETFARKAVGELTEEEYEKKVVELKKRQKEANELLDGLKSILANFQ